MPEIRQNRVTGEWVIIAPERAKRGTNLTTVAAPAEIPSHSPTCPFCPGNEGATADERHRVCDDGGRWTLRSIVNKFSVLSAAGGLEPAACPPDGETAVNGVGLHEVLVECPEHHLSLAELSLVQVQRVLQAYRHRFLAFYADPRIRHVIIFKNNGADAGASQQHPHSQIVGLPIVPGQVVDRLERARRFHEESGQCMACSMLAQELQAGTRVVAESETFVAFIPFAALSPYHLWILPKAHTSCFSTLSGDQLAELATILRTILAKLHGMLRNPPFNLVIRSLSPAEEGTPHFHWYISVVARVVKVAGFELGTGMYVNPSLPDISAQMMRDFQEV